MSSDHALFDRDELTRRRRRARPHAAAHDILLATVTDDLLDRLGLVRRDFSSVAVLGSHLGTLGRRLSARPGVATLIETDPLASATPAQPQRNHCVVADEEWLPFRTASLDLLVAPLSLQTVNDLPGVFAQVHTALKADGLFLASMTGGETLTELRQAFLEAENETTGGITPRVHPAVDIRAIGQLLQRAGFALPVVDSDRLTLTYASPIDLMRDLRGMGATNVLSERSRRPLRRETLARVCDIYAERFADARGRIRATFEIITFAAWTPHPSQQKPLRPGTATSRLANALGATISEAGKKAEPST